MKIYVITAGSYSDYQVYGATTDPDRAEDMRRKVSCHAGYTGDEAEIKVFEDGMFPSNSWCSKFDETVPVKYWLVEIRLKSGDIRGVFEFWDDAGKQIECSESNKGTSEAGTNVKYIIAEDEEHAIKIAKDCRAKFLEQLYGL